MDFPIKIHRNTRHPILKEGQSPYYSGCGCTWDTDKLGRRFDLLDNDGLPLSFERKVCLIMDNYLEKLGLVVIEEELGTEAAKIRELEELQKRMEEIKEKISTLKTELKT